MAEYNNLRDSTAAASTSRNVEEAEPVTAQPQDQEDGKKSDEEMLKSRLAEKEKELVAVRMQLENDSLEKERLVALVAEKEAELVAKTGELARLCIKSRLGNLVVKEQNLPE